MKSLTRLLITEKCTRLIIDYAWFADEADGNGLASLFSADGVLVDGDGVIRTPLEMRKQNVDAKRPATLHVCSNVAVDVLSDVEASGRTLLSFYYAVEPGGKPHFAGPLHGHYLDTFTKTRLGWRFARREYHRALPLGQRG